MPLSRGKRWLLSAFGVPAVTSVEVAAFTDHSGSGLTAIAICGGLALLTSAVGVLPRRIQIGENSVDFAVSEAVDAALAGASAEQVEEIQSALPSNDPSPVQDLIARRVNEHVLFHQAVLGIVAEVAGELGASIEEEAESDRWDAVVRGASGSIVYVEAALRLDPTTARAIGQRVRALQRDACALIVFLDDEPGAREALGSLPVTSLVRYRGDRRELSALLRALLTADDAGDN